jgi:transaldolase
MKSIQPVLAPSRRFWLDGITRSQLDNGALRRCIDRWPVTGLTFNAGVFADAIRSSPAYDAAIREKLKKDVLGEALLFALALEDIRCAADLFRPLYDHTHGVDGWVSLEASPLLAHDPACTLAAVKHLHARAGRSNLYVKIPGTTACLPAVEEAIFAGIPVNVTLLFSRDQYLAAADAFLSGIERRIASGLAPDVHSVASIHVGPWEAVATEGVPEAINGQLGMAVAAHVYHAWRELLDSSRWARARDAGVKPQRLVWASVEEWENRDPAGRCTGLLAFADTVINVSEGTLGAFADHGEPGVAQATCGRDGEGTPAPVTGAGIDINALAGRLQQDAAASQVNSWIDMMGVIASRSAALAPAM